MTCSCIYNVAYTSNSPHTQALFFNTATPATSSTHCARRLHWENLPPSVQASGIKGTVWDMEDEEEDAEEDEEEDAAGVDSNRLSAAVETHHDREHNVLHHDGKQKVPENKKKTTGWQMDIADLTNLFGTVVAAVTPSVSDALGNDASTQVVVHDPGCWCIVHAHAYYVQAPSGTRRNRAITKTCTRVFQACCMMMML